MRPNRKHLSCLLFMVCSIFCTPSFAGVQGQPAAFTLDGHRIGVFVTSDSGRLYRVVLGFDPNLFFQVKSVVWEDLNGTQLRPSVTALDPKHAFVIGDGNLYAKYWDGNAWQWSYQGNPGVTLSGNISVVSYAYNGTLNDAVFVVGDDNRLYVNWWDGQWQWSSLGGTALTHYVSAVTYVDRNNNLQIKVYVVGGDGNLYVKFWDGNAWQWGFVGRPNMNVTVALPSAALEYLHTTDQVFVVGSDGRLYAWDATSAWVDMGGSQLANPPATALDFGCIQGCPPHVFIVGGNGTLYGSASFGGFYSPGGCFLKPFVSPTSVWGNIGYFLVFAIGGNGRFYAIEAVFDVGFCGNWQGYDLSAYPGAP
jgi:hypothetical protein